jgi:hypothetical protein
MFNILQFTVDEITGQAEVKVSFQAKLNGREILDGGVFTNRDAAKKWLHHCQKDWFLTRVENYIAHKKIIIENAPRGHKSHAIKLQALDRLLKYIAYVAKEQRLFDACKYLLAEYDNFLKVLPAKENASYQSSVQEIELLYKFAKEYYTKAEIKKAA